MPYKDPEKRRACQRERSKLPEVKARRRELAQRPEAREKAREYAKEWRKENSGYMKEYDQLPERKEKHRAYQKEYSQRPEEKVRVKKHYKKRRDEADKLLGNECVFCGKTRGDTTLAYHKKDGQPHPKHFILLVIKNPDEWGLVCKYPCHNGVHWCMEVWGLSWEEIVEVFKVNSKKPVLPMVEDSEELYEQCAKDLEPIRIASDELEAVFG